VHVNILLIYSDNIVLLSNPCTPASLNNCLNIHLRVFILLFVILFCVVFPVVFGIDFTAESFTALYHISSSLSTIPLFVKLLCEVFSVILSVTLFLNRLEIEVRLFWYFYGWSGDGEDYGEVVQ